jgi:hypothetical protein
MSRLNPIWTAGRLNEALASGRQVVVLSPDGRVLPPLEAEAQSMELAAAVGAGKAAIAPQHAPPVGEGMVFVRPVMPTVDFESGLTQLPPLLSLLAINAEPCCEIMIRAGKYETVGPFLDYANPLWEWLVRAARGGLVRFIAAAFPFSWETGESPVRLDEKRVPLPELLHRSPRDVPAWLRTTLEDFDLRRVVPSVKSAADAVAVSAGLLQMHDFATESHERAQSVEGQGRHRVGDYWHAIHHRREPDPGNAKYWFRHVGSHPILGRLAKFAGSLALDQKTEIRTAIERLLPNGTWDSFAFVDFCQEAASGRPDFAWVARRLQFFEMTLLLAQNYEDATS